MYSKNTQNGECLWLINGLSFVVRLSILTTLRFGRKRQASLQNTKTRFWLDQKDENWQNLQSRETAAADDTMSWHEGNLVTTFCWWGTLGNGDQSVSRTGILAWFWQFWFSHSCLYRRVWKRNFLGSFVESKLCTLSFHDNFVSLSW